jgi:sigma-E factor negative regulatory protein RseA
MSEDTQQETLSALVDDEAGELEYRRLLREFGDDDAATWSRWHLARDLMHGHESVSVPAGFAAGVRRNLGERRRPAWMNGAARLMVAASVAAATVVGWQFWDGSTTAGTGAEQPVASNLERAARLNATAGGAERVAGGQERATGVRGGSNVREAGREQHLNDLMIRHSDLSARHASQGVTANARLINLESQHER